MAGWCGLVVWRGPEERRYLDIFARGGGGVPIGVAHEIYQVWAVCRHCPYMDVCIWVCSSGGGGDVW